MFVAKAEVAKAEALQQSPTAGLNGYYSEFE